MFIGRESELNFSEDKYSQSCNQPIDVLATSKNMNKYLVGELGK